MILEWIRLEPVTVYLQIDVQQYNVFTEIKNL